MIVELKKPECKLCKRDNLDRKFARDLIYSMFNPFYFDKGKGSVSEFIKESINDPELKRNYDVFSHLFNDLIKDFGYASFSYKKLENYKVARKKAWKKIKERINSGELENNYFSSRELLNHFYEEILRDLIKDGYIKKVEKGVHRRHVTFSPEAERILGEKVLTMSIQNLEKRWHGENITSEKGTSISITNEIEKFDPMMHTFDMIDLQETMIKSALKSPELNINDEDIVVREPKHLEKCIYVLLIDSSDSMRGKKIIGAIESALALRKIIRRRGQDELHVITFNHRVKKVREGDILNLTVNGRTDIGLALKTARNILKKENGTGIVLLITDGEPTSSSTSMTPWRSAITEARNLRIVNARMSIIMFGREKRFINLCNQMARESKKSNIVFIEDPLNLKKFVVWSYLRS